MADGAQAGARAERTLDLLDRLIDEADAEIGHLQRLLAERPRRQSPHSARRPDLLRYPGPAEASAMTGRGRLAGPEEESSPGSRRRASEVAAQQRPMVVCLGEAGFTPAEIAAAMHVEEQAVQMILDNARGFGRAAA